MRAAAPRAHTSREANLFIATRTCQCGGELDVVLCGLFNRGGGLMERRVVECLECGLRRIFDFGVARYGQTDGSVNPTAEPSELLDVTQWTIYVYYYMNEYEKAERRSDPRRLLETMSGISEGLTEILKFYPKGSLYPSRAALFSEGAAERFAAMKSWFHRRNIEEILRAVQSGMKGGRPGDCVERDRLPGNRPLS